MKNIIYIREGRWVRKYLVGENMSLEMLLSEFIKDVNGCRRYLELVNCENVKTAKMILNVVVYGYDEGYIDLVVKDKILNCLLEEAEKDGLNEEIENIKYWMDYY